MLLKPVLTNSTAFVLAPAAAADPGTVEKLREHDILKLRHVGSDGHHSVNEGHLRAQTRAQGAKPANNASKIILETIYEGSPGFKNRAAARCILRGPNFVKHGQCLKHHDKPPDTHLNCYQDHSVIVVTYGTSIANNTTKSDLPYFACVLVRKLKHSISRVPVFKLNMQFRISY